jgi:hypothetical protein
MNEAPSQAGRSEEPKLWSWPMSIAMSLLTLCFVLGWAFLGKAYRHEAPWGALLAGVASWLLARQTTVNWLKKRGLD